MGSQYIFWLADNVEVWRPYAIMILAIVFLASLYFAIGAWEKTR